MASRMDDIEIGALHHMLPPDADLPAEASCWECLASNTAGNSPPSCNNPLNMTPCRLCSYCLRTSMHSLNLRTTSREMP